MIKEMTILLTILAFVMLTACSELNGFGLQEADISVKMNQPETSGQTPTTTTEETIRTCILEKSDDSKMKTPFICNSKTECLPYLEESNGDIVAVNCLENTYVPLNPVTSCNVQSDCLAAFGESSRDEDAVAVLDQLGIKCGDDKFCKIPDGGNEMLQLSSTTFTTGST